MSLACPLWGPQVEVIVMSFSVARIRSSLRWSKAGLVKFKVIIYKSRGEPFLWNRIWDLGRLAVQKCLDWAVKYATFEVNFFMGKNKFKLFFKYCSVCTKNLHHIRVRKLTARLMYNDFGQIKYSVWLCACVPLPGILYLLESIQYLVVLILLISMYLQGISLQNI